VLTYAEFRLRLFMMKKFIGSIAAFDWLHLHHEDFTGQYGKFLHAFKNVPWYIEQRKKLNCCNQIRVCKVSIKRSCCQKN
jgi:hypothetical protein